MPLINLIIILVVVGVILWLINTYIPMDRKIKSILNIVVVIVVILWLLSVFGMVHTVHPAFPPFVGGRDLRREESGACKVKPVPVTFHDWGLH